MIIEMPIGLFVLIIILAILFGFLGIVLLAAKYIT